MKNVIIFDLDGTLADVEHRRHLVQYKPPKWDEFYAACTEDSVVEHVRAMFQALRNEGYALWIFSGRSDAVDRQTWDWLQRHDLVPDMLLMRPEGDFTPDEELKESWLYEYGKEQVLCVFDDRNKVVDMWRRNGIPCFQVAPGDF